MRFFNICSEFVPRAGVSSIMIQEERTVENVLRKRGDEAYKAVELERERLRKKMVIQRREF
jgi:hypothetical protein